VAQNRLESPTHDHHAFVPDRRDPVDGAFGCLRKAARADGTRAPAELTALEVLALVAILEAADERVNAHPAPMLQLIPT
jgi:hypothetical protein